MLSHSKNRLLVTLLIVITFGACQKIDIPSPHDSHGHLKQTKTYSSEVALKWLEQQLKMFQLPLAQDASAPSSDRAFAYSGIALYEAVVPGMASYRSLGGQLTDFPQMPLTKVGLAYHWPASANAALAAINRSLFPGASTANKQLMDQLESELQAQYATEVDEPTLQRSIEFGRAVAQAVWSWAQTDGTALIAQKGIYTIPTGEGFWTKEYSPANPANAFHQLRRQMVSGSRVDAGTPPLPFSFSTDAHSDYFKMAKEVYDISQSLTTEQRNIALYHREGLGFGGGSSVAAQLQAVITQANTTLDIASLALAKVGIGSYEALTLTFIQKYQYLVMRPITYIRNYMGHPKWNTLYGTPPYPEYPAGHPTNGGVLVVMLTDVFGSNFSFDVDYYSYLSQPSRHYDSFEELAQEMAISRFYAGIHYKPGVYAGVDVGKKVAQNVLKRLSFMK